MAHNCAPSAFKQAGQDVQDKRRILLILSILLIFLILTLISAGMAEAAVEPQATPTPQPTIDETGSMFPLSERLAPPPTVYPPAPADQGAQVYYLVCMVCHGDRGQGLTEDYLNLLDPVDRNCWQSHCHASNHPLEGFVLPKFVPAIIGPGRLAPFPTALNLHDFLQARMPWQAPGSLSEDEYWQLTAYLLRANGYDPGQVPLDQERSAAISLGAKPMPTLTPTPGSPLAGFLESAGVGFWVAFGGILALGLLVGLVTLISRSAKGN